MSGDEVARRYRFGELRRAGLFGSVAWSRLMPAAVGLVAAWLAVSALAPWPLIAPLVLVAGWVTCGRVRGRPAHAVLPALLAFWWRKLRRRTSWIRPVPLVVDGEDLPATLPAPLAGLAMYEVDVAGAVPGRSVPMAVVHDRRPRTVTAVLRVPGDGQFPLLDNAGQDARLDGWGSVLAGFARERGDVVRVGWADWVAPVPLAEQVGRLRTRWADEAETAARTSYLALMDGVAPKVTDHDLLVTVSTAVPPRAQDGIDGGPLGAAIATLRAEVELLVPRLAGAELHAPQLLSAAELVTATRTRSDPAALEQVSTLRQSLAAAVGLAAPTFGPFNVDERVTAVRVDRSWHRTWWFACWPRREVPAGWLDKLMFECACTRTVTAVFEPVPPSRSDRAVDRELVHREANIESRERRGFRVTGKDRKALAATERREDELNAGFPEMSYCGFVTLTAPDEVTLEAQSGRLEQTAAQVGVDLQAMWGQQGDGWVASLPLGRTVASRLVPS